MCTRRGWGKEDWRGWSRRRSGETLPSCKGEVITERWSSSTFLPLLVEALTDAVSSVEWRPFSLLSTGSRV
jgi:hypothetical protein